MKPLNDIASYLILNVFICSVLYLSLLECQEMRLIYNLRDGPQIYAEYVKKYGKKYNEEEYYTRYHNFMHTLRKINEINSKNSQKVQLNKYADWSESEWQENVIEQTTKIDFDLKMQLKNGQPKVESLIKDLVY